MRIGENNDSQKRCAHRQLRVLQMSRPKERDFSGWEQTGEARTELLRDDENGRRRHSGNFGGKEGRGMHFLRVSAVFTNLLQYHL